MYRPFTVIMVFSHGVSEINKDKGAPFKVNGQRVKYYVGIMEVMRSYQKVNLHEVCVIKGIESWHNIK